jgi:hypothetical protein
LEPKKRSREVLVWFDKQKHRHTTKKREREEAV